MGMWAVNTGAGREQGSRRWGDEGEGGQRAELKLPLFPLRAVGSFQKAVFTFECDGNVNPAGLRGR